MKASADLAEIGQILDAVRPLAVAYYIATRKPLGITAEMAEYEAARILGLDLCPARQAGYDACRATSPGPVRVQVKGRRLMDAKSGHRVGCIKLDGEWDSVMLVLLDVEFYAKEIWEADRPAITAALLKPGSKARNERRALSVTKFKAIGKRLWP